MNLTVAFNIWRLHFNFCLSTSFLGFYATNYTNILVMDDKETSEEVAFNTWELSLGVAQLSLAIAS